MVWGSARLCISGELQRYVPMSIECDFLTHDVACVSC